jgi:hypothetical protein
VLGRGRLNVLSVLEKASWLGIAAAHTTLAAAFGNGASFASGHVLAQAADSECIHPPIMQLRTIMLVLSVANVFSENLI